MTSHPQLTLCSALLLLCCPQRAAADKLQITSTPPGATVELDGVVAGATPFEKDFPGGYFRKTRTSMGSRLEHPVVARISLAGYVSKEIKLAEGPMNWISLNGRNRGEYWLFKSAHFSVELQPISETFTGGITAKVSDSSIALAPELSLEELVRESKPAVVYLKGLDKSGSGFFVTGTGVIVTNAHLARRFYPHAVPRMERASNFETGRANSTESVDSREFELQCFVVRAARCRRHCFHFFRPGRRGNLCGRKISWQYACHAETYYWAPRHRLEIRWPR